VASVGLISTVAGFAAIWSFTKKDKLVSEAKLLIGKEVNIGNFEKNTFQDIQKPLDNNRKTWMIYLVSTCDACKDELQFAEQLSDDPVSQIEIVGIMAEDQTAIKQFVEEHHIKFPILIDPGRNFAKSIRLKYYPSNFIVNDGKIEKVIFGSPQDKTKLADFIK
jgi:peroxiredoxin